MIYWFQQDNRIDATLTALADVFGAERDVLIARELTKIFEESVRLPLGEALTWLNADPHHARGEFVLVIYPPAEQPPAVAGLDDDADKVVRTLVEAGLPTKQVAQIAQQLTGVPKDALYQRALDLKA